MLGASRREAVVSARKFVLIMSFGRWHSLMGNNTGFLASALWVFYFLDKWKKIVWMGH